MAAAIAACMATEKVGMNMRFDDSLDIQSIRCRFAQVDVYVTSGIDDDSAAGGVIAD